MALFAVPGLGVISGFLSSIQIRRGAAETFISAKALPFIVYLLYAVFSLLGLVFLALCVLVVSVFLLRLRRGSGAKTCGGSFVFPISFAYVGLSSSVLTV